MTNAQRRVVVTGAGSGIGQAVARKLAATGAQVVLNDLDPEGVAKVARELQARAVVCDASTEAGVAQLVAEATNELGDIDVWFGNAGVERGRGLDADDDSWQTSYEVNVLAHVRAARLLVPRWLERGQGRYVVTASAAGLLTMLGSPAYSVTKHGAIAFAEWLSVTYRHRGIVVQAVCPQGVRTPMLASAGGLQTLLGRDGTLSPEEVADVVSQALTHRRFLILPHREVRDYVARKAEGIDPWLAAMNRVQQRLETASGLGTYGGRE